MRLSTKLPLALVSSSAITGLSIALLIAFFHIAETYQRTHSDIERYTTFVERYLFKEFRDSNGAEVYNPLAVFGVSVSLFAPDRKPVGIPDMRFSAWREETGEGFSLYGLMTMLHDGYITRYLEVRGHNGEISVYIGVSQNIAPSLKVLYSDLLAIAVVFSSCMAASLLFGIAISMGVLSSLRKLKAGVSRMEDHDFSPIHIDFNSEVGELGHAFNKMSGVIRQNFCELEGRQRALEDAMVALNQERAENNRLLDVITEALRTQRKMQDAVLIERLEPGDGDGYGND